ncbi:ABC transporter permease [Loktanella sp. 3ANDIMAR09]|uniref:cation diffusion facilitator family transporter n=1 Tax=Loktanella sp. 3ANDIMAR09 TaxID=1225657 RepID=UPI0006F60979|nr:cation diffusion facilitator family transporter [Loktanella sp. 3ANDIMAR09]KQI69129.1 ABC transporter permease [Loktanella sp. 3ANDIMAR09]
MSRSDTRLNLSAGLMSSAVALTLVIAKLWALGETGSLAVAATLADSAMDLMMSLGALAAIAYAAKPADDDHNFGHSSAEDLAALGQSLIIIASAGVIATVAVLRLVRGDAQMPENEGSGMAVIALSIVLTLALVLWQRRVAARTDNAVVKADSLHYLGDLIPNVGALVALWASSALGLAQVDSVVALGAALILVIGAVRIGKAAWDALMDRQADPELIAGIAAIAENFEGVHGFHDLKTRRAGSRVFVNLHIELDGDQTLHEAHAIGAALRRAIIAAYPRADVLIHKDPRGVQPHPDDPRS